MIVEAGRPLVKAESGRIKVARPPLELFAGATALLLPIAFASGLQADAWSVRAAILLVVLGIGLPKLIAQTRGPQPLAPRAAVAFLWAGSISSALSQNRTTAVFGLYNQGTGLLFMASLAAIWAIGRSLRSEARPMIEAALLAGIAINAGVAMLASLIDLTSFSRDLTDAGGRSSGLAGNPVHLAALAVLGLALIVPRFVASPARWALLVTGLGAATQLSGTRGAVVVMAAIVVWATRRHNLRIGAMLAALLVLGLAAGTAVGTSTATTSATGRVAAGEGLSNRPATWLSARHSIIHHPLLGIGPGQFRTATSRYHPISVARSEGPEKLFTDAHNIFVEYATTTGLLGLGALLIWVYAATRQARGWLLVGALGVLVIHLFEPQSVVSTPLAFLALGAGGSLGAPHNRQDKRRLHQAVPAVLLTCTVVAASVFLAGEFNMRRDLHIGRAEQADRLLPAWPETASLLARAWLFHGITNHHSQADYERSRSYRLAAVERDSADPGLWLDLADLDASLGQNSEAKAEYTSAVALNPTSARAMTSLARLAGIRCDVDQAQYWRQRALVVSPPTRSSTQLGRTGPPSAVATCAAQGLG